MSARVMKSLASSLFAPRPASLLLLYEPIRHICPVVAVVEVDGEVVEERARSWIVDPARTVVLQYPTGARVSFWAQACRS